MHQALAQLIVGWRLLRNTGNTNDDNKHGLRKLGHNLLYLDQSQQFHRVVALQGSDFKINQEITMVPPYPFWLVKNESEKTMCKVFDNFRQLLATN